MYTNSMIIYKNLKLIWVNTRAFSQWKRKPDEKIQCNTFLS